MFCLLCLFDLGKPFSARDGRRNLLQDAIGNVEAKVGFFVASDTPIA